MKVLLLAGYRLTDDRPLGLARDSEGHTLIERRVRELQALGLEVVCVLAGNSADEVLRECPLIADVELVFDTNGENSRLASNLKAGLHATDGEGCFVLPVEIPCPPRAVWHELREEWRRRGFHTEISAFHPAEGAPWHFPLLISRNGNGLIRQLQGFASLTDSRIKYQHLTLDELPDCA